MSTSTKYKYPRTLHLPWSLGAMNDDRICESTDHFVGKEVIVTEKMDGENTSIYKDFFHARSITGNMHPTRNRVKQLQSKLHYDLRDHIRICGENCYAKHSISYSSLPAYFLAFSVWENDLCFSWDETLEWCELLDVKHVPVLYRGIYDEDLIKTLYVENREPDLMEGYVVRLASSFSYDKFSESVAKFVRANHVQCDEHWMNQEVVPNLLVASEKEELEDA